MSLTQAPDRPVHFPRDPQRFVFDEEVTAVFDDMAVRSIPNFLKAHESHSRMLRRWMIPGVSILDVGASRGAFLRQLRNDYQDAWYDGNTRIDAIDNSEAMCKELRQDFPEINVNCTDISAPEFLNHRQPRYDIVCLNYVLQFIPPQLQVPVMLRLFSMVEAGGVFILGHKSKHHGMSGDLCSEEYIHFRMQNGYSAEEIAAKTEALKGSMFPMDHTKMMHTMKLHFSEVAETFRFMMFSTVFAVK